MTKLRCCFCQQELEEDYLDVQLFGCENQNCKYWINNDIIGSKELWQELIRTHKELEQSEICCTEWEKQALDYKAENIALSGELEHTRKALEIAVDALKWIHETFYLGEEFVAPVGERCEFALEQITATLENQNGNC